VAAGPRSGPSGGLWQAGWLSGGFFAGADPSQRPGQVRGGVLPAEWPGGLVVAVGEGEQGSGELAGAGEIIGRDDLFLDDGEEDFVG
jgi:hypothetical protein